MKRISVVVLGLALAGCSMDVPDLNNPSIESLETNPTRSGVSAAATGLLIGHRGNVASANGYVAMLGILGREAYNFDTADPRYVTEMLASPFLDPGSPAFGGNFWNLPYANIRNGFIVLGAVDKVSGLTDDERNATRGFTQTIQALDFLTLINTRDSQGIPIDVNRELGAELPPIVDRATVHAHVAALLDEAAGQLAAGGDAFPFPLSSGFAGFDTPATFLRFNRAIKARVDVYRGEYDEALVALDASFLDPAGALDAGVYHAYGTGSGDAINGLNSPNLFAHPSIRAEAELKLDGDVDDRVAAKLVAVEPRTLQELTSSDGFAHYPRGDSPVPIIRNEELILLRAEAYIGLDRIADAIPDLNLIRTASGGLEPRTDLDASNIVDELLKQRRYSLLFEGGHSWIDHRRHGRLDQLPLDQEDHTIHSYFPIPVSEMDARQ